MCPDISIDRLREGLDLAKSRGFKILGDDYKLGSSEWFAQSLLAADFLDDNGFSDVAEFIKFYGRGWFKTYSEMSMKQLAIHFQAVSGRIMNDVIHSFVDYHSLLMSLIGQVERTAALAKSIKKPCVSVTVMHRWGLGRLSKSLSKPRAKMTAKDWNKKFK